jgi:hypothetical protein
MIPIATISGEPHAYVLPPSVVDREQRRAHVVDPVRAPRRHLGQRHGQHRERCRTERQVHVEDGAPGDMRRQEAADQRPGDARDTEDRAEQAGVAAALARRHDIANRRLSTHQEAAGAEPLDRAEHDQLGHRLRQSAERRADQEDDERRLQHDLAAVLVAELAVERRDDRRRQEVRGHHPRQVREPAEVADDRRQRCRDNRLVQRCEQQDQHQAGHHHR